MTGIKHKCAKRAVSQDAKQLDEHIYKSVLTDCKMYKLCSAQNIIDIRVRKYKPRYNEYINK